MYCPAHFEPPDRASMLALMRAAPLATLVVVVNGEPRVEHLPLLASEDAGGLTLRGHVARGNDLWRRAGQALPATVVFHGPQAYVSPSWYPSKAVHGRVVPTWNYAVVQARGQLQAVEDRDWLYAHLSALTAHHEAGRAQPWTVDDAPADFLARLLGAVVGLEIVVEHLAGKFKLGQNRDRQDRAGVVAGLADSGTGAALAALMGRLAD